MMKSVIAAVLISRAYGHAAMTLPRPWNQGARAVHPSPGHDPSCLGDACYWYSVGCNNGCPTCSNAGKSLYPSPVCSTPIEPTNNDAATRSWDPLGQSSHGDFTKYNPWRAPGTAPVVDSCGVASGYSHPAKSADIPAGYKAMDKGTEVLPEGNPTFWKAGGAAEVGWAVAAQHGGGYSYRLCPKSEKLTEACFQSNHLSFTKKNTTVRYTDGSRQDFQIPTTNLITQGKHWRRNPIPGCSCDLGWNCDTELSGAAEAHMQAHFGLGRQDVNLTSYAKGGPPTPACPKGTMFDAGWTPEGEGFLSASSVSFSIIDEVQVPNTPGEYVLSWRWDCEQTPQVWNNCADIIIAHDAPPSPAPTPSPPGPAPTPPSPAPGKKSCKGVENPTCNGSFTTAESCWTGGCKTCRDGVLYDCDECCDGCSLAAKGGIHYCSWTRALANETDIMV